VSCARRLFQVVLLGLLLPCALAEAQHERLAALVNLKIEAQSMDGALDELSRQSGIQLIFPTREVTTDLRAPALNGTYTLGDALDKLLANSGLRYELVNSRTVAIRSVAPTSSTILLRGNSLSTQEERVQGEGQEESSGTRFRLAQATQGQTAEAASVAGSSSSAQQSTGEALALQEVIVTAQKREERLQDVPVPVTVLNTEALADTNQVLLKDYVSSVPGLEIFPSSGGTQALSIRGITVGFDSNPVVGIMIDGVPYGPSAGAVELVPPPDVDPGDLARIEVLRGPQGTLFGADSLGGLVNFVTADPSTDRYSGRVEAGTDGVHNGHELGYSFRASANIPLGNTFAVRVSGFDRHEPGYIDNPVLNLKGVNSSDTSGARLAALWTPSDIVSLKLNAVYQDTKYNGVSAVDTQNEFTGLPLTGLQQSDMPGTGESHRIIQAYSATFKVKLGDIDLTSLTGYNHMRWHDNHDDSGDLGVLSNLFFGVNGETTIDDTTNEKFTEELRFSGSLWHAVDWLVGGYYTHEHNAPILVAGEAVEPTTGQLRGLVLGFDLPQTYAEYAAFADLTYHITDQFDVQVGGRGSRYSESNRETDSGALFGPTPIVGPLETAHADAFTYLLTPRFKISPDLMVYARFASGFRPGGNNCADVCTGSRAGAPATFSPDKTYNYELGTKADFLDHRLSIDGSLYYIQWKGIQLSLDTPDGTTNYEANGNNAKSEGLELSVEARPATGLTLSGWVSYDNAVLTQPFPAHSTVHGDAGDRLANSARFSGNLSLQQDIPISTSLTGFAGGKVSYVGDRLGVFTANGVRQTYPAYTKLDLRAGLYYGSWTASVYVNNVADRRGLLSGGIGTFPAFAYYYIQPRTVGLNVVKNF